MVPEYVPAESCELEAETWILAAVEPLDGLTLSHGAVLTAVQASEPVPEPPICTVFKAGLAPR